MKYFAYGANMDLGAMKERCPEAIPLGPAYIQRHTLEFHKYANARLTRENKHRVYGILWECTKADIVALDRFEGDLYNKQEAVAFCLNGAIFDAMFYRMVDDARDNLYGMAPELWYINSIKESYLINGFPLEPIKQLMGDDGIF